MNFQNLFAAIDPMALILSGHAYQVWVEKHNPHVPRIADIQEALNSLSIEERQFTITRARNLVAYGKAVDEALSSLKK